MYVRLRFWHTKTAIRRGAQPWKGDVGSYNYSEYSIYIDDKQKVELSETSGLREAIHNFNYHKYHQFHKAGVKAELRNIWVWWPDILEGNENPRYTIAEFSPNAKILKEQMKKAKYERENYHCLQDYGTF